MPKRLAEKLENVFPFSTSFDLLYYFLCMDQCMALLLRLRILIRSRELWAANGLGYTILWTFFPVRILGNYCLIRLNISISTLIWGFPAPIILALMLNEVQKNWCKKTVQTITYMPHFISLVVACGLIKIFVSDTGLITTIFNAIGLAPAENMLGDKTKFVPIYVVSGIWQEIGWGSIIYIAALSGINQELYEAASIDGAGRWRQLFTVTLPGIMPTIVIMLILRMGSILYVYLFILLYNPLTYDTADVISSYCVQAWTVGI